MSVAWMYHVLITSWCWLNRVDKALFLALMFDYFAIVDFSSVYVLSVTRFKTRLLRFRPGYPDVEMHLMIYWLPGVV